jgi:hypothetical protein
MNFSHPILLVILGIAAAIAGTWIVRHFFSGEARWERRRRRSNAPITTTAKRPMVKFSVRTRKSQRK